MSALPDLANFRGHQVRVAKEVEVRKTPQAVVPANDVADALQYDRAIIRQMVSRKRMIARHSVSSMMLSTDGKVYKTLCLTYEGVIGVVLNLEPERIADHRRRKWVEDFQDWAVNTLAKVMRGEVPTRAPEPPQGAEVVSVLRNELAAVRGELANLQQQLPTMTAEIAARVAVAVVHETNRPPATSMMEATGRGNRGNGVTRKKRPGRLPPDSPLVKDFLDKLRSLPDTFTQADVKRLLGWNKVRVHRYCSAADRNGQLQQVGTTPSGGFVYRNPWVKKESILNQIFGQREHRH